MSAPQRNKTQDDERGPAQAELLVRLAMQKYRIGQTDTGEPFAVAHGGPNLALMFRGSSDALRSMLAREFRQEQARTPSATALAEAMTVLQGEAMTTTAEPVALRLAEHRGGIVIDIGDGTGRAVVADRTGWEVVKRSPVLFRRTALTGALPIPSGRCGKLVDLRDLLNVTDETWPLLRGWAVSALLPNIPHPILMLGGIQGTGKSTAARFLVGLVDPSPAPLRSEPRDPEAWALAAAGSWAVCVDNVSGISGWWSDALCKSVSGDGWVRRRLYTDGDLSVVSFRRVIVLTTIDAGALRGDLGDRLLLVDLERIADEQRRAETELEARYQKMRPALFAGLLDDLVSVLHRLPGIRLDSGPRMYDFARVLAALDDADGADGRSALSLFLEQRGRIAGDVIDSDPVALAVVELVRGQNEWAGTAAQLLARVTPQHPPHGWPASPRAMAGRLRRLMPALRGIGVEVQTDRAGHERTRTYTLRNGALSTVRIAQPSANGDGRADGADGGIHEPSEDDYERREREAIQQGRM